MGRLADLFAGGAGELAEKIGKAVDVLHTSKEEKGLLVIEMEKIVQQRVASVEETYRAEIAAKASMYEAEMAQEDKYTKRTRPSIIYVGLAIALMRMVIYPFFILPFFIVFGTDQATVTQLTELVNREHPMELEWWMVWGGVAGAYVLGRTSEKKGSESAMTQMATGNGVGLAAALGVSK